ncbi:MAG: hypothetical protein ACYTFO_08505, partial [Planctomycetota bacterium]
KRDHLASIFYQSPWWRDYRTVEDYFARIGVAMTQGAEVRDLLVIHPIESVWLTCTRWQTGPADPIDVACTELRDSLLTANIDFDYGDEDILARHAKVRRGDQPTLRVNKAEYKAVVVPPMRTIRKSTLALLKRFQAAGGLVVFAGDVSAHVDALPSQAAADLAADCVRTPRKGAKLVKAVDAATRRVSITDAEGKENPASLYMLREDAEAFYLFVCNTGHRFERHRFDDAEPFVAKRTLAFDDVRIWGFAECNGAPIELDASTGERFAADARRSKAGWEVRTSLPQLGSRLFVFPKRASRAKLAPRPKLKHVSSRAINPKRWDLSLSECNCLVLDRATYRIGSGGRKKATEVLTIDQAVRDSLGLTRRGGQMVQPWARKPSPKPKHTPVEMVYTFNVDARSGHAAAGRQRASAGLRLRRGPSRPGDCLLAGRFRNGRAGHRSHRDRRPGQATPRRLGQARLGVLRRLGRLSRHDPAEAQEQAAGVRVGGRLSRHGRGRQRERPTSGRNGLDPARSGDHRLARRQPGGTRH